MNQIVNLLGTALLVVGCNQAYTAAPQAETPQPTTRTAALPVCNASDGRTAIPVWEPAVDADGNLSSDPPQQNGQIVYVAIDRVPVDSSCDNTQMVSLARPDSVDDPMQGGLAVNLRGNAHLVGGACQLRGYYTNQDVEGMHQGWIETYFGAVEDAGTITPDKYCLAGPIRN